MIDVVILPDALGTIVVVVADAEGADSVVPTLPAAEHALMTSWATRRQRTFALGRFALRGALAEAGLADVDVIGRDDRGAPVLPAALSNVRCSITHKDHVATDGSVVIVAAALVHKDARDGVAVGIDLEFDDGDLRARYEKIAEQTLTVPERATLPAADIAFRRAVLVRFSLKEAIYKAIDPVLRRYVGFKEVSVAEDGAGFACDLSRVGTFAARGRVVDVGVAPAGQAVVLTVVRVDRSSG